MPEPRQTRSVSRLAPAGSSRVARAPVGATEGLAVAGRLRLAGARPLSGMTQEGVARIDPSLPRNRAQACVSNMRPEEGDPLVGGFPAEGGISTERQEIEQRAPRMLAAVSAPSYNPCRLRHWGGPPQSRLRAGTGDD